MISRTPDGDDGWFDDIIGFRSDFPRQLIESILGPPPNGSPAGMRRAAAAWFASGRKLQGLAARAEHLTFSRSSADDDPLEASKKIGKTVQDIHDQASHCFLLAEQLRHGAERIVAAQLAWARIGTVMAIQLTPTEIRQPQDTVRAAEIRVSAHYTWRRYLLELRYM